MLCSDKSVSSDRERCCQKERCTRAKKTLTEREKNLKSVLGKAITNSGATLAAKLSQTGLRRFFVFFLRAVESPHTRGDGLLNVYHLLGPTKRDLSHENVTKKAARGCRGTFRFLEKRIIRVTEFGAVAVKVLHLSDETACAKDDKTSAKLFVERVLVQLG